LAIEVNFIALAVPKILLCKVRQSNREIKIHAPLFMFFEQKSMNTNDFPSQTSILSPIFIPSVKKLLKKFGSE